MKTITKLSNNPLNLISTSFFSCFYFVNNKKEKFLLLLLLLLLIDRSFDRFSCIELV